MALAAGCVYFNALYNANRLFDQGRREMAAGSTARGRSTLEQAIEKAERILQGHPESRWADDALRLIAEARILREEWPEAAEASRRLMSISTSARDSARVAGYLGTAEFRLGNLAEADSLLTLALADERDEGKGATVLLDRAQARHELGRVEGADADYRAAAQLRPDWIDPHLGRARLLVENGRGPEGAFDLATAMRMVTPGHEEAGVMETAEYVAETSPEAGLAAFNEVELSGLSRVNKAILITLRGDLRRARSQYPEARADYELAIDIAGNNGAGVAPHLALAQMDLRELSRIDELAAVRTRLDEASLLPPGPGAIEVRQLLESMKRVEYWVGLGDLGYVAAAEVARDELGALRLARHLFLEYARVQPDGLWAPKAILAALDLTSVDSVRQDDGPPDEPSDEELRQRLIDDYGDSAYVQIFLGGSGGEFTYEELEAGLRRQLQRLDALADAELNRSTTTPKRR